MPKPEHMFRDLGADASLYRRQYRVVSHAFTHPTLLSMNPRRPSLDWALIVAEPYRMAALSLWAVLDAAETERPRGWRRRLGDIQSRLTTPPRERS
jgi:hypothetical protein